MKICADYTLTSTNHPAIDAKGLTVDADTTPDITEAGIRDAGEVIAFPLTIKNPTVVVVNKNVYSL